MADEQVNPPKHKGKYVAIAVCWLLGIGCLFPWNSLLTIEDYFMDIFPDYHPSRIFTLIYPPFALTSIAVLAYYEATINTRNRNLGGYIAYFVSAIIIIVLDLATSGKGGLGTFIGICIVSAAFGVADANVLGGMVGDLAFMTPELLQAFLGGLAGSGAITSALRLITKAAFDKSKNGLRKGALLFFGLLAFVELLCTLLYAIIFPKLPIVRYYRSKAASEGCKTVQSDLAAGGVLDEPNHDESVTTERLSNKQLLYQNIDYALDLFLIYVLTLSIFPGFLSEDTGNHSLGNWYALVLIAVYNASDLIGRYIPSIQILRLQSRKGLMLAVVLRFLLVPCFYFTSHYGDQGWMIFLTSFLGISNGYLNFCALVNAPEGYKGPEQNALGNILMLFQIGGLCAGALLDWLWLIGKGW